ncbi:hypothetical protein EXN66_Car011104 [Channa argus]|uniref:Uncharacterized protein n=1 Tax=Channa argus TaxID=215402 RepID=A0A6G1PZK1_CHAAH|nr:hypothetical protein EXN66_Car011104 [Channa argus]
MDNLTRNKGHIPCQSWLGQSSGWSESILNPLVGSQHLSMGSSDQIRSYDHLQASGLSCMSNLGTLSSGNNSYPSSLYKATHISSHPSSSTVFANTAVTNTCHTIPFAPQNSHNSSTLITTNQGKIIPPSSLPQPDQGLQSFKTQHLPLLLSHNPYKTSVHPPLTHQGLSNELQDLPISLPSCGHVNTSQGNVDGAHVESAGGYVSATSQPQSQWELQSHCRGAVDKSVPDALAHPETESSRNGDITPMAGNESRRSALLQQRAQLLQQLAEMDKLLESVPQDNDSDEQSPSAAAESPSSMDDLSQCEETGTTDAQQVQLYAEQSKAFSQDCSSSVSYDEQDENCDMPEDQMSTGESEVKEHASAESGDGSDSDYEPNADGDVSDFPSDTDGHASDGSSHSSPSREKRPPLSGKKREQSGSSSCEEQGSSPAKKTCTTNLKMSSEAVVLPMSNSKTRVYDRRNYCLFCSRSLSKMARHLERMHSDKTEVAAAFQYPPKSKERQKIWNKLINEGNFAHNKEVLRTGKGQLAVRKRPKKARQAKDFFHCLYCRGLFAKKTYFRHMKKCPERAKNESEPLTGRKPMALRCVLEVLGDIGISDGFRSILCGMIYDDVTQAIMNDKIILQFGEQMFNQYGSDAKKHGYIKQNLRHLGRLVLEAQKTTPLKSLEEFFYLSSFRHVVSAVNVLAGYDPESKTYSIPSLALKLGYHLQKACSIVQDNAMQCGDESLAESAQKFFSVYQKKWNKLISSGALTTLRKTKLITKKKVPLAQDVKCLNFHLEKVHPLAEKKLRESPSAENYAVLAKVLLARVILFNRRKGRQVSLVQLKQFMSRKKSSVLDDMDISVSDLERTMCGLFTRIDIRGTSGRMVPVLLKPSFVSSLELLIDMREKCGISSDNHFVFGRPSTLTAYNGGACIQHYIKECGAKDPEALTLKKIREHYGTMLQLINLDEDEAYQILGPNNKVQALRQNSDMQLDDVEIASEGFQHRDQPTQGHKEPQKQSATTGLKEAYGITTDTDKTVHPRSATSRKKGSQNKDKQKWGEAEVCAVEKHLMRFIEGHKVPQKNNCIQCLEAEPEALKRRTWKGVKDYVRNRITTLKRQSGSSKASSKNSSRPVKAAHVTPHTTEACIPVPAISSKSKGKGAQSNSKDKHKWSEAEVHAVERHLMSFIHRHKVPQKNDCIQCLVAEPVALKTRTWKGVKDYVRNRITSLKRQRGSSQSLFTNRSHTEQTEPHESTGRFQQW